jgi:sugar phosphate isomerase/epimerase
LQISLAQWSLHRSFLGPKKADYWQWFSEMLQESPDSLLRGELDPWDFPSIAAGYGITTIELVNVFYFSKVDDDAYWLAFELNCKKAGVSVSLIMCDGLGNLADLNSKVRQNAVDKHAQWVDIAKLLGAHAIRVNLTGEGSEKELASNAVDGLTKLAEYGASKGINILVENHGGISSNGAWLADVMQRVNRNNVGTLPDFGNFCMEHGPDGCVRSYDPYQGVTELMPFAKGVSAKSHVFDTVGNEINIDFHKMMAIVKRSGYHGYIGIEYEGEILSEDEGIKATKQLLEKVIERL